MKIALKLTLDGLLRARKGRAHRLAEEVEAGRPRQDERTPRRRPARARERNDDDRRDD